MEVRGRTNCGQRHLIARLIPHGHNGVRSGASETTKSASVKPSSMQLFAVALIAMCFARATAMPVNSRDSSGNQPSQRSGIDRGADSWLTTFTLPASFYVLNKWYGPSVKAGRNKLTSTTKFDIPKDVQDKALEDETCFIAEEVGEYVFLASSSWARRKN